jgi:hypothetical protein
MPKLDAVVRKKQDSQEALLKLPGVTGVDVGYKYVKGKRTDEIAIRVMVEKKKENVPAEERIPEQIEGIKTDVIQRVIVPFVVRKRLAEVAAAPDTSRYDPLKGGISIGPDRAIDGYVYAGTLGCIVTDHSGKQPLLLSNFHVMAVDNGWKAGDDMDQPSKADGGTSSDRVGTLVNAVLSDHVDGALCTVNERSYDCSIVSIGDVKGSADASLNSPVRKRGRTTLLTYGFVDAINGTVKIDYGDGIGTKTLSEQIGIRADTAHNAKFSDHGDSGSVVVDADNHIIGLLFAGSEDGYTYINPIANVLSEFDIRICTGSTGKKAGKQKETGRKERSGNKKAKTKK